MQVGAALRLLIAVGIRSSPGGESAACVEPEGEHGRRKMSDRVAARASAVAAWLAVEGSNLSPGACSARCAGDLGPWGRLVTCLGRPCRWPGRAFRWVDSGFQPVTAPAGAVTARSYAGLAGM
jgi:hypothetical protein